MRWWIRTDAKRMSVDNASVGEINFASIDADILHVNFLDGKGEIQRKNDNGLREDFFDVTPYAPLFQQFLHGLKAASLVLNQAKKVQVDLIQELFESKRQLPVHYVVSAGDYWWDATDGAMANMAIATIPGLLSSLISLAGEGGTGTDTLEAQLNANYATWHNEINTNYTSWRTQINTNYQTYATEVNARITSFNANIEAAGDGLVSSIGSNVVFWTNNAIDNFNGIGNALISHINTYILGYAGDTINTVNNKLQSGSVSTHPDGTPVAVASPGLAGNIPPYGSSYTANHVLNVSYECTDVGGVTQPSIGAVSISALSVTVPPLSSLGLSIPWTPLGEDTSVILQPTEIAGIMSAVATRRTTLLSIKMTKVQEINAMTAIDDVIAYDVLADWPVIPLPPGFKQQKPSGSSVTIIGEPIVTSGVPEAPSDGVTYGRKNAAWNPALALSGDVLDGGSF